MIIFLHKKFEGNLKDAFREIRKHNEITVNSYCVLDLDFANRH